MADFDEKFTDKSIQTFDHIGAMKLAMPNAKIVIVRRDPRDNLLSIYKNVFPVGTHQYSYNLTLAAEYYKLFVQSPGLLARAGA